MTVGIPVWQVAGTARERRPKIDRLWRAGLSDLKRCWIIVDEYNDDVAEQSWYLEPDGPALGRFSKEDRRSVRREVAQIGSPRQSDRPSGRPAPIAPA